MSSRDPAVILETRDVEPARAGLIVDIEKGNSALPTCAAKTQCAARCDRRRSFTELSHLCVASFASFLLYVYANIFFTTTSPWEAWTLLFHILVYVFPMAAYHQSRRTKDRNQNTYLCVGLCCGFVAARWRGTDYVASLLGLMPACLWLSLCISTTVHELGRIEEEACC